MDRQFFQSKEFATAALLAALVVAAGAYAAVGILPEATGQHGSSCEANAPTGDPIEPEVDDTGAHSVDGHTEQTITWTLDPGQRNLTNVHACTDDRTLSVQPAEDDRVSIVAELVGDGDTTALENAEPRVRFAETGGQLFVTVDHPRPSSDEASSYHRLAVHVEIHVPSNHTPSLDLRNDDGDVTITEVRAPQLSLTLDDGGADLTSVSTEDLRLRVDDGDVVARELEVQGDVDLRSDDGTFHLEVASIGSGDWQARTDDGTVFLDLPAGDEIGYDAEARADRGHARIVLENSGIQSTSENGRAHARSTGFADRATQVLIDAVADDGTIEIASR